MWIGAWVACSAWSPVDGEAPIVAPPTERSRTEAMRTHQVAVHRARDAVIAQDLDGVRRAGEALAEDRSIPQLPPPALSVLAEVREGGAELAHVSDLDAAATALVELTQACARCHTMLEVPPAVPLQATQRDVLWTALVFRSEEHWQEGARRDRSLRALEYWEDRRLAVALRMQGGQL